MMLCMDVYGTFVPTMLLQKGKPCCIFMFVCILIHVPVFRLEGKMGCTWVDKNVSMYYYSFRVKSEHVEARGNYRYPANPSDKITGTMIFPPPAAPTPPPQAVPTLTPQAIFPPPAVPTPPPPAVPTPTPQAVTTPIPQAVSTLTPQAVPTPTPPAVPIPTPQAVPTPTPQAVPTPQLPSIQPSPSIQSTPQLMPAPQTTSTQPPRVLPPTQPLHAQPQPLCIPASAPTTCVNPQPPPEKGSREDTRRGRHRQVSRIHKNTLVLSSSHYLYVYEHTYY